MKPGTDTTDPNSDDGESWLATVRADLAGASGFGLVAVMVLVAWLVFQWGFGNDTVLAWISALSFDSVDDRETWGRGISAVTAAGLTGFLFWTITQIIDAVLVLSGMSLMPRVIGRLSRTLRARGWVKPYAEMKWSTRWIIAYATGASALCLVDVLATGRHGFADRRRVVATAALLSSSTVGLLVALVALVAVVAVRVPATADEAEVFIRFARNPLTWIAIFATLFLVGRVRARFASD